MAINSDSNRARRILAAIDGMLAGLPHMSGIDRDVPPTALIELLSVCATSKDENHLLYKGQAQTEIKERLYKQFLCNKYEVILNSLATAEIESGTSVELAFWALASAEAKFLRRYMPFASHEERATGFLLASLVAELGSTFESRRGVISPPSLGHGFEFGIFDTATTRNERQTGADVGIVVRSGPISRVLVKAARLQFKIAMRLKSGIRQFQISNSVPRNVKDEASKRMFDGRIPSDLDEDEIQQFEAEVSELRFQQLNRLTNQDGLGYYVVLDKTDEAPTRGRGYLPPIVLRADNVNNLRFREEPTTTFDPLDPRLEPIALSAFLGLGLTASSAKWGVVCEKDAGESDHDVVRKAIDRLFSGASAPKYGLFVDVSAEPLGHRLIGNLTSRIRPKHGIAPESPWTDFNDDGDPTLAADWIPSMPSRAFGPK